MLGWDETDEVCARAAELDDRAFVAEVFARRKVEAGDVEGWARRKQELTLQLLADSPRIYPGLVELVATLRGRFKLGVVSTTWRGNIQVVLEAAGLLEHFDVVVAKEDTASTKPDPEGYRLALDRLGLGADEVVAIEDSPMGPERGDGGEDPRDRHRPPKARRRLGGGGNLRGWARQPRLGRRRDRLNQWR